MQTKCRIGLVVCMPDAFHSPKDSPERHLRDSFENMLLKAIESDGVFKVVPYGGYEAEITCLLQGRKVNSDWQTVMKYAHPHILEMYLVMKVSGVYGVSLYHCHDGILSHSEDSIVTFRAIDVTTFYSAEFPIRLKKFLELFSPA